MWFSFVVVRLHLVCDHMWRTHSDYLVEAPRVFSISPLRKLLFNGVFDRLHELKDFLSSFSVTMGVAIA